MSRRDVRQNRRAAASAPAPPGIAPFLSANPALILRADLGVTIATGVSAWRDQSGTGDPNRNVTQSTGANQPTLTASDAAYGNQATIQFSGASVVLLSNAWASPLPAPYTIFIVGHTTNSTTSNDIFIDALDASFQLGDLFGTGISVFAGATLSWGGHGTLNTPRLVTSVVNGASSSLAISTRTAGKTGNAGTDSFAGMAAGNAHGGGAANSLFGTIAEIRIYPGALSAGDVDAFATYVTTRYGIAVGA